MLGGREDGLAILCGTANEGVIDGGILKTVAIPGEKESNFPQ